jgi:hypothetical protein
MGVHIVPCGLKSMGSYIGVETECWLGPHIHMVLRTVLLQGLNKNPALNQCLASCSPRYCIGSPSNESASHTEHLRDTVTSSDPKMVRPCAAWRWRYRTHKFTLYHFQDVDPLQDYPAPRYAVESDDSENESFVLGKATLDSSPVVTVQFPKPPLLPALTSLVVLIGSAGQQWLHYVSPAPTLQSISCNDTEVGVLYAILI